MGSEQKTQQHAVVLKLPEFWTSHPWVWFQQTEAQFALRQIFLSFLSFGRDRHPTVSKSDAGSDGTQSASCVDIQNRQSTYSCGCPMYGHVRIMCFAVCSAAPHSQFDVGARPHLCMND